ncbi:MAG: 6,7-dimethyl-8-ribityllumazine synthase [Gammaproteobacteria bacterium]
MNVSGPEAPSAGEYAIVTARFNSFVTTRLAQGARDAFVNRGIAADAIRQFEVAGAWELAPVIAAAARTGRFRALVACAAVIRGETAHFEHIARACMDALARVQTETQVPIGLAVLTTDTVEQAIERAGGKAWNKGEEAALAALEAADVLDTFRR